MNLRDQSHRLFPKADWEVTISQSEAIDALQLCLGAGLYRASEDPGFAHTVCAVRGLQACQGSLCGLH